MSDYYTCEACGERYSVHDDNHEMYCSGSPDDRIEALEKQVKRLQEVVAVLLTGRTLPMEDVLAFCEEAGVSLADALEGLIAPPEARSALVLLEDGKPDI